MEVIAYASMAYLLAQLLIVLINIMTRTLLRPSPEGSTGTVSVLIPARNEAANIGNLLDDLRGFGGAVTEILVFDDDSDDDTAGVVDRKEASDPRIRCIRGTGPHAGWLGKTFACDRLAREARGDFLMFLDADVRVRPELLQDSWHYLQEHELDLLSIFPVQQMKTPGEWLTVPWMNRILLGNLPLIFIRAFNMPDFSAANGQFMLFRAVRYREHWFHEQVKSEKVEDIRIMKLMKKKGLKTQTLLSNGQISCRMYGGLREGLSGFSKNIHAFFGKNWLVLILFVLLTALGPLAAGFILPASLALTYFLALAAMVSASSWLSRQNIPANLALLLPQLITLVLITVMAGYRQLTGQLYWKGRKI